MDETFTLKVLRDDRGEHQGVLMATQLPARDGRSWKAPLFTIWGAGHPAGRAIGWGAWLADVRENGWRAACFRRAA